MQANTTFLALNAVPTVAASAMYLSPFRHAASRCSVGTGVLSRQAEILPSSVSQPWPWRHFRQNVKYAPCPMWWVRSRSVMSLADVRIVQAISRSSPPRAPKRRPGRTSSFWRRPARQPAKVRARNWSAAGQSVRQHQHEPGADRVIALERGQRRSNPRSSQTRFRST